MAAFAAATVFADSTWKGESGFLEEPSSWNNSAPPAKGGTAQFTADASYSVLFTDRDYTAPYTIRVQAKDTRTVTFDGAGRTLLMPSDSAGTYASSPLYLGTSGLTQLFTASDGDTSSAVASMSNALFRLSREGNANRLDFDRGSYDFLTPGGSSGMPRHYLFHGSGFQDLAEIVFHAGTASRLSGINLCGRAAENVLRFEGGSHVVGGAAVLAETGCYNPSVTRIEAAGDAELAFSGDVTMDKSTLPMRTQYVSAIDGGTVRFAGSKVTTENSGHFVLLATNGGVVTASCPMTFSGNGTTTARVEIADAALSTTASVAFGRKNAALDPGLRASLAASHSTLSFGGALSFYAGTGAAINACDWTQAGALTFLGTDTSLAVTGGTVRVSGDLYAGKGAVVFRDSDVRTGNLYVPDDSSSSDGSLTIGGGVFTNDGGYVSVAYYGKGRLSLKDGAQCVFDTSSSGSVRTFCVGGQNASAGTLEISGDRTRIDVLGGSSSGRSTRNYYLGSGSGAKATILMTGGVFNLGTYLDRTYLAVANTAQTTVGLSGGTWTCPCEVFMGAGSVDMTVSGGTFACGNLMFVKETPSAAQTQTLRVTTDGIVNAPEIGVNFKGVNTARLVLDGGVVRTRTLYGADGAASKGGTGRAELTANGGTVEALQASTTLLCDLDSAALGAQGLTIRSDYSVTVAQDFSDLGGAEGLLALEGTGVKTLGGTASAPSKMSVRGGTVRFGSGACCQTAVEVVNAAVVDFNGQAGADNALTGLSVGDENGCGRLRLAKGETVRVAGDVALASVQLELGSGFAIGDKVTLVDVAGTVDAASRQAWETAFVVSGLPAGSEATFAAEEEGGHVLLTLSVETLTPVKLTVTEGTSTVTDPIVLGSTKTLQAEVSSGAFLDVQAPVHSGSFVKTGAGRAVLSNAENVFMQGVTVSEGLLSLANAGALGMGGIGSLNRLNLVGGTFELTGPAEGVVLTDADVRIETPTTPAAVIVKNEVDLDMPAPTVTSGSLIKRGAGTLTLVADADRTLAPSAGSVGDGTDPTLEDGFAFDPEGAAPAKFKGFNVAEGRLVVTGAAEGVDISLPHDVMIGMPVAAVPAQPVLELDHVAVASSGKCWWLGAATPEDSGLVAPKLVARNGASVSVSELYLGRKSASKDQVPEVLFDASTLTCSYALNANYNESSTNASKLTFRNGSGMYVTGSGGVKLDLAADFVFDRSVLAKNAAGDPLKVWTSYKYNANSTFASFTFRNGSLFACNQLQFGASGTLRPTRPFLFAFDGSEWRPGTGDFDFLFTYGEDVILRAEGDGLILAPPTGKTWTLHQAVTGPGGIVKRGAGTLSVQLQTTSGDPVPTLACTGTTTVEEGTLELAEGAASPEASVCIRTGATLDLCAGTATFAAISGGGAVVNGTLTGALFATPVSDAGVVAEKPSIQCAVSGRAVFDLGRDDDDRTLYGKKVVVATYSGAQAPDVSSWRVRHAGKKLRGVFSAADGEIAVTLTDPLGLMLLVR